jgi:hypothetical protein
MMSELAVDANRMLSSAPHVADELVAAAVNRPDVGRILWIVAERLPEDSDRLAQRGVGDVRVRPGGFDKVLFRDHFARLFEQAPQHSCRAGRNVDLLFAPVQEAQARVELDRAECNDLAGNASRHRFLRRSFRIPVGAPEPDLKSPGDFLNAFQRF